MRITNKGYRIPELDDRDFWDSYNFDIERLDGHNHDGVNSEQLTPGAFDPYKETIEVADWVGAGAPFHYDFIFPAPWDMLWADDEPCPVFITARDSEENIVYLEQGRAPSGLGVRLYSSVKLDLIVGVS